MMRDYISEGCEKDIELGLSLGREWTRQSQNEIQEDSLERRSADLEYEDAAAAGQKGVRESGTWSWRSDTPPHVEVGRNASRASSSRYAAGLKPTPRPQTPVNYASAGDSTRAPWPRRRFKLRNRGKTSVFRAPDLVGTARHSSRRIPLDPDNPGPWVINHHRDQLLRKVVGDSAGGLLRGLFGISATGKSGPKDEKSVRDGHDDTQKSEESPEPLYRISFAEMQRMHLRKLHTKLIIHAVYMYTQGRESSGWESDLAEYIQGLKDYDYMTESSKLPQDFFLATGERGVDRYVIDTVIKQMVGGAEALQTREMKECTRVEQVKNDSAPIGGIRGELTRLKKVQDFRDRTLLAMIGASLLLGPMWLMVLHNTLYTGLVTTTVCVAIVGLVASWRLEKPIDVLSVTAAYAAVLVVFVGLTNSD